MAVVLADDVVYLDVTPPRSWCSAGAATITVADSALPWTTGQEIVLASTDFEQDQAEVPAVQAPSGAQILLTPGNTLSHMHYGRVQNFDPLILGDPAWNVDQGAEAGLLSRNVEIRSDSVRDRAVAPARSWRRSGCPMKRRRRTPDLRRPHYPQPNPGSRSLESV